MWSRCVLTAASEMNRRAAAPRLVSPLCDQGQARRRARPRHRLDVENASGDPVEAGVNRMVDAPLRSGHHRWTGIRRRGGPSRRERRRSEAARGPSPWPRQRAVRRCHGSARRTMRTRARPCRRARPMSYGDRTGRRVVRRSPVRSGRRRGTGRPWDEGAPRFCRYDTTRIVMHRMQDPRERTVALPLRFGAFRDAPPRMMMRWNLVEHAVGRGAMPRTGGSSSQRGTS